MKGIEVSISNYSELLTQNFGSSSDYSTQNDFGKIMSSYESTSSKNNEYSFEKEAVNNYAKKDDSVQSTKVDEYKDDVKRTSDRDQYKVDDEEQYGIDNRDKYQVDDVYSSSKNDELKAIEEFKEKLKGEDLSESEIESLLELIPMDLQSLSELVDIAEQNGISSSDLLSSLKELSDVFEEISIDIELTNETSGDVLEKAVAAFDNLIDQVGRLSEQVSGEISLEEFESLDMNSQIEESELALEKLQLLSQESATISSDELSNAMSELKATESNKSDSQISNQEVSNELVSETSEENLLESSPNESGLSQGSENNGTSDTFTGMAASLQDSNAEFNVIPESESFDLLQSLDSVKSQNTNITSVQNSQATLGSNLQTEIFNQVLEGAKTATTITESGAEMILKLTPENLGKVEMKIAIEKGIVIAEINVENETVKAAIESNLDDLRNALLEKGFDPSELNVNVGSQNKKNSSSNHSETNEIKINEEIIEDVASVNMEYVENTYSQNMLETLYEKPSVDLLG